MKFESVEMALRDRPKFGFGFGYGAEIGNIFSFGYVRNREAWFRPTFGYGRNCNHSFGVVSVSAETENIVSAAVSVTAVTEKCRFGLSLMALKTNCRMANIVCVTIKLWNADGRRIGRPCLLAKRSISYRISTVCGAGTRLITQTSFRIRFTTVVKLAPYTDTRKYRGTRDGHGLGQPACLVVLVWFLPKLMQQRD